MSMLRKKIGSFYLVERIGTGGMSEVFLGINPRTREKRAYKVLGKCASMTPSAYARFLREVDTAVCYVNASTQFTDGTQFGMGAEIIDATQKSHARGPVGLREICTYKWIVFGNGQTRPA